MGLETADSKIQEICERLRKDTLDPARAEAEQLLEAAHRKAEQIVEEAKNKAELTVQETKRHFQEQLSVYEVSLGLAIKQALAKLRQEVMKIFHAELGNLLLREMDKPNVIAKMLAALLAGLEKEGLNLDLRLLLPKALPIDTLFENLIDSVKSRLRKEDIALGDFSGGIALKLIDRKMVIDMSDKALKELLISYASEELREKIFTA